MGCVVNFLVFFGYVWKEIVEFFLKGFVKFRGIRNIKDFMKFKD